MRVQINVRRGTDKHLADLHCSCVARTRMRGFIVRLGSFMAPFLPLIPPPPRLSTNQTSHDHPLHPPEIPSSERPRGTSFPIAQTLSTARPANLFLGHRSDDQMNRRVDTRSAQVQDEMEFYHPPETISPGSSTLRNTDAGLSSSSPVSTLTARQRNAGSRHQHEQHLRDLGSAS